MYTVPVRYFRNRVSTYENISKRFMEASKVLIIKNKNVILVILT